MRLLDCFVGFQEVNLHRSFRGNIRGRAIKPEAHYIVSLTLANGCELKTLSNPSLSHQRCCHVWMMATMAFTLS